MKKSILSLLLILALSLSISTAFAENTVQKPAIYINLEQLRNEENKEVWAEDSYPSDFYYYKISDPNEYLYITCEEPSSASLDIPAATEYFNKKYSVESLGKLLSSQNNNEPFDVEVTLCKVTHIVKNNLEFYKYVGTYTAKSPRYTDIKKEIVTYITIQYGRLYCIEYSYPSDVKPSLDRLVSEDFIQNIIFYQFHDVHPFDSSGNQYWAFDPIKEWSGYTLVDENDDNVNIINGDESSYFKPDENITRAQLAKILSTLLGLRDKDTTDEKIINFITNLDKIEEDWKKTHIKRCLIKGIISLSESGEDVEEYCDYELTRAEAMVMIAKALINEDSIDSETYPNTYDNGNYIEYMINNGYIQGDGNGNYSLSDKVTRAQIIKIIDNMVGMYIYSGNVDSTPQIITRTTSGYSINGANDELKNITVINMNGISNNIAFTDLSDIKKIVCANGDSTVISEEDSYSIKISPLERFLSNRIFRN